MYTVTVRLYASFHLISEEGERVTEYSPVKLIVVIMRLPPKVEPDQQQTEGEEEDERPQQLPLLREHTNTMRLSLQ